MPRQPLARAVTNVIPNRGTHGHTSWKGKGKEGRQAFATAVAAHVLRGSAGRHHRPPTVAGPPNNSVSRLRSF